MEKFNHKLVSRDVDQLQLALDEIQAMQMRIDSSANRLQMIIDGNQKLSLSGIHADLLDLNKSLLKIVPVISGHSLPERPKKMLFFTKGDHGTTKFFDDKTYTFDDHKGYTTSGKIKVSNGNAYMSDDQIDAGEEPSFALIIGETAERLIKYFSGK